VFVLLPSAVTWSDGEIYIIRTLAAWFPLVLMHRNDIIPSDINVALQQRGLMHTIAHVRVHITGQLTNLQLRFPVVNLHHLLSLNSTSLVRAYSDRMFVAAPSDSLIAFLQNGKVGDQLAAELHFPCNNGPDVSMLTIEHIFQSQAKPKRILCQPGNRRFIWKQGDNLFQDQVVIGLFCMFNAIWDHHRVSYEWRLDNGTVIGADVKVPTYNVAPLDPEYIQLRGGFIEVRIPFHS